MIRVEGVGVGRMVKGRGAASAMGCDERDAR